MNEAKRRREAAKAAEAAGVNGLLVTHPADVRYLTGFTGSAALVLVTADDRDFFEITAEGRADGIRLRLAKHAHGALRLVYLVSTASGIEARGVMKITVRK